MIVQKMYSFLRNVYLYVWLKEGKKDAAALLMREWGLSKEDWKEMWKNELPPDTGDVWK